mmetsp:Transcript_20897/g.42657  ORF Transcript_20897/g.42657 Transcript_20897/m.42657 type:complete len:730 (+) Transcript_20897:168-2357(+)
MVRTALRSPRDDPYYQDHTNDRDDDFTIKTSDFAIKTSTIDENDENSRIGDNANTNDAENNLDAKREYDAFMSTLDDRQKNAIKVLDTWFELKSSCMNQMTEMEEGNAALRDAVSRSKSARHVFSAADKELGMKLGIGAASINYTGAKADAKPLEEKIVKLENKLSEVSTELDRERSKSRKIKETASNALKARKKDVEMLKSKLRYYKKENEALQAKLVLYRQALDKAEEEEEATREMMAAMSARAPVQAGADVAGASVEKEGATCADDAEKTTNEAAEKEEKEEGTKNEQVPKSTSPIRYDRNMLRRKMRTSTSDVAVPEASVPIEEPLVSVPVHDESELKQDEDRAGLEETQAAKEEENGDSDLTFSDLLAMDHPEATRAPKALPKFSVSSTGAFDSASRQFSVANIFEVDKSTKKEQVVKGFPDVDKSLSDLRQRETQEDMGAADQPKRGTFAVAMKSFETNTGNAASSRSAPGGLAALRKKTLASSGVAVALAKDMPSTPASTTTCEVIARDEMELEVVPQSESNNEPVVEKVESEEEPALSEASVPVMSKVASLAASYGTSVRGKRMSFERTSSRSEETPVQKSSVRVSAAKIPVPIENVTDAEATKTKGVEVPALASAGKEEENAKQISSVAVEPITTPQKDVTFTEPLEPTATTAIGPGSAQKELEELRSMLRGRGGMANKKLFETRAVEKVGTRTKQKEEDDANKFAFKPDWLECEQKSVV